MSKQARIHKHSTPDGDRCLAAMSPDVRKASGFPAMLLTFFEALPRSSARRSLSDVSKKACAGKAKPYRTSGGIAALQMDLCQRRR